jgi:hypothetical protein
MPTRPKRATASRGAKRLYLIKRRKSVTREEFIAHWAAGHMPPVITSMNAAAAAGDLHAFRYSVTLLDPAPNGEHVWDGIGQLTWNSAPPLPPVAHGTTPTNAFQRRAEPYVAWATTEYVVIDGELPVEEPFPSTRSGFFKTVFFIKAQTGTSFTEMFDHYLEVHAPNVAAVLPSIGGFRYVLNLSEDPANESFAACAEIYFRNPSGLANLGAALKPDGMERFIDPAGTIMLTSRTELVGIP